MIVLRPATHADEQLVADIILASMLASYARFLPAHRFQRILDMDRPGQVARTDAARFTVAEANGTPAGILLRKGDYVDHLWVRPEFMGQGVGSALLAHAEERAAKDGFDRLTLDCFEKNKKALAFYRNKGFRVTLTRDAAEYMPGENTCSLVKSLSAA